MIRAAFFDVDGTLVSHAFHRVPPETRRSLEALREKGIRLYLSTGRHASELERLPVRDISFDGYVTLNGQLCLDADRKTVSGFPFPEAAVQRLADLFKRKRFPMILTDESGLILNYADELVLEAQEAISSPVPKIGAYSGGPVFQATVYVKAGDEQAIREAIPEECRIVRWSDRGVDLLPAGGGKAEGIRRLLAKEGILPDEIIAFGDGENDISMLELAGIGVAMGNAPEIVRASADYVTANVDDDGIGKALRRFGLL